MTLYHRGQTVQHLGSSYVADSDTSGEPGVDPAWRLLARGVPAPDSDGQVLVSRNGRWVAGDAPASGGGTSLSGSIFGEWQQGSQYPLDAVVRRSGGVFVSRHAANTVEAHTAHPGDWAVLFPPVNEPDPLPTDPVEDDDVPKQITQTTGITGTVHAVTNADGQARMQVTFAYQTLPNTYTDTSFAQFDHWSIRRNDFQGSGQMDAVAEVGNGQQVVIEQPADGKTYLFFLVPVDQYGIQGIPSNALVLAMTDGSTGTDQPSQPE